MKPKANNFNCPCCGIDYDITPKQRVVRMSEKRVRKSDKCPKWLSIIWKGRMVQINEKGKIRKETKNQKN